MIILGVFLILCAFTSLSEGMTGTTIFFVIAGSCALGYGITNRKHKQKQTQQQTVIVNNYTVTPEAAPAPVQNTVAAAPPSVNIKVNRKTFTEVRFPVAGVTFRNDDGTSRQKILREICDGDDFGTALGSLEEYDFEGEQAIRVVTADGCVGNIRKSDLKEASKFLDHMVHHIDVEVETFENDDGKVIYRADVVLNLDPDDPEQRWFFDDLSKS